MEALLQAQRNLTFLFIYQARLPNQQRGSDFTKNQHCENSFQKGHITWKTLQKCRRFGLVYLCNILTSDIISHVFLWFLTRSLLKETGTLESQLEANKVRNVYSLVLNIAGIYRSSRTTQRKLMIPLGKSPGAKVKSLRLCCQSCQQFAF